MIRQKDNALAAHGLNFCEVEVLSCPPGRWGYNLNNAEDCLQTCDRCLDNLETCGVSDGYCFTGCEEGFWGGSCDKQCTCLGDEPCRGSDGYCFIGCKDGLWGGSCSQRCNCRNDDPCRVLDGYCYTGCKNGFWGDTCDKQCNCVDDEPFRVSDGYCFSGCKDGLWGRSCDEQCDCLNGDFCDRLTGCPVRGESHGESVLVNFIIQIIYTEV